MKVLVADCHEQNRIQTCQAVETIGLQPLPAVNETEALSLFRTEKPDIVILDLSLSGPDNTTLLRTFRGKSPGCQIIIVTSTPTVETAVASIRHGASAYLVRNDDFIAELDAAVIKAAALARREEAMSSEIIALRQGVERLRDSNNNLAEAKDHQTGLYGSGYFDETLNKELMRASRTNRQFSIVLVRLNPNIEMFDEQFLFSAREKTFPSWSRTIQERLRKSDIVARFDDNTLSIILPETGKQGALLVAECLIQLCDEVTQAVLGEEIEIADLIQVGIASFPDDGDSKDRLIALASKRSGSNTPGTVH